MIMLVVKRNRLECVQNYILFVICGQNWRVVHGMIRFNRVTTSWYSVNIANWVILEIPWYICSGT